MTCRHAAAAAAGHRGCGRPPGSRAAGGGACKLPAARVCARCVSGRAAIAWSQNLRQQVARRRGMAAHQLPRRAQAAHDTSRLEGMHHNLHSGAQGRGREWQGQSAARQVAAIPAWRDPMIPRCSLHLRCRSLAPHSRCPFARQRAPAHTNNTRPQTHTAALACGLLPTLYAYHNTHARACTCVPPAPCLRVLVHHLQHFLLPLQHHSAGPRVAGHEHLQPGRRRRGRRVGVCVCVWWGGAAGHARHGRAAPPQHSRCNV